MHFCRLLALFSCVCFVHASDALIKPGTVCAVIEGPHLRAIVPADQAAALQPLVARADAIYAQMAHDAGYTIKQPLVLLLTDDVDSHNGFSTVVPAPLVNVQLAPASPESFIFAGDDELERTITHEFTHHLGNDRNHGVRRGIEWVFGRVLPNEPLSLLLFYLSTPAHLTMPSFWQEGTAQWAETAYADPSSPWAGRGRDSMTHMVWRLEAAAGVIPQVGDWRLSYTRWPFGTKNYAYGLAYTRWLAGAYGDRAVMWPLIESQGRQWAFAFTNGSVPVLGADHAELLARARAALLTEQQQNLALIRKQPVTTLKRLTPVDCRLSAPVWLPDGRIMLALDAPTDDPRVATVSANGDLETGTHAWSLGAMRSLADGTRIRAEADVGTDPWTRTTLRLTTAAGDAITLSGERLLQPDVCKNASESSAFNVAAIQLLPAHMQQLVIGTVTPTKTDAANVTWQTVPTQDRPWSPAFRPGHAELAWVETDHDGSRLVLAPLADLTKRKVLTQVRGRLLHPAFTSDGKFVFVCSDVSGVSNAYRIELGPGAGNVISPIGAFVDFRLKPVTNTIGGVIACVPSFDGKELALIDHDTHGPFLARIAYDPAKVLGDVPEVPLTWPAPVLSSAAVAGEAVKPLPAVATNIDGTPASLPAPLPTHAYHGLTEIRPLFWTPTTYPVPEGGIGVAGFAADPLFTHELMAGIGRGLSYRTGVGLGGYVNATWKIEFAAIAWRSERVYDRLVESTTGARFDFGENVNTGEIRAGYGLAGRARRFQLYLAGGIAEHRAINESVRGYDTLTQVSQPIFVGTEQYVEATIAYDDHLLFPTSYAGERGNGVALTVRTSGLGGELHGQRLLAQVSHTFTVWPSQSHQVVIGGLAGWSHGDRTAQGAFAIGGGSGVGLPRGYGNNASVASGDYLLAGSIAYRLPLWRPFHGFASSPWVFRQLVLEGFYDLGQVTRDHLGGNGPWYRSVGGELHAEFEFWSVRIAPGVGVAQQLAGDQDTVTYFNLGFGW